MTFDSPDPSPASSSPRPGGYDDAVSTYDRTVAFLYELIRDHVAAGTVEAIIAGLEEADERHGRQTLYQFSNDFVAAYAIELNERLAGTSQEEALRIARYEITKTAKKPQIHPQLEPAAERTKALK